MWIALRKTMKIILALTDKGMALAFAEKLAAQDPAYAQTAEVLRAASGRKGRKAHD